MKQITIGGTPAVSAHNAFCFIATLLLLSIGCGGGGSNKSASLLFETDLSSTRQSESVTANQGFYFNAFSLEDINDYALYPLGEKYKALFAQPVDDTQLTAGQFYNFAAIENPSLQYWLNDTMNRCGRNALGADNRQFYVTENFILYGKDVSDESTIEISNVAEEVFANISDKLGSTPSQLRAYWTYYFDPGLSFAMREIWTDATYNDNKIDIVSIRGDKQLPEGLLNAHSLYNKNPGDSALLNNYQAELFRYWFSLSFQDRILAFIEALSFIENLGIDIKNSPLARLPFLDSAQQILEGDNDVEPISQYHWRHHICIDSDESDLGYMFANLNGIHVLNPDYYASYGEFGDLFFGEDMGREIARLTLRQLALEAYGEWAFFWFEEGALSFLNDMPFANGRIEDFNALEIESFNDHSRSIANNPQIGIYEHYQQYTLAVNYLFHPTEDGALGNNATAIKNLAVRVGDSLKKIGHDSNHADYSASTLFTEAFEATFKEADGVTALNLDLFEQQWEQRIVTQ